MTTKEEERLWQLYVSFLGVCYKEAAYKKAKEYLDYFKSQTGKKEKPVTKPVVNNIKEREASFLLECSKFISVYNKNMVDAFFAYWSEPNQSGSKMRWEMQDTWDLGRRMKTWAKRSGIEEKKPKKVDQDYINFMNGK